MCKEHNQTSYKRAAWTFVVAMEVSLNLKITNQSDFSKCSVIADVSLKS